MTSFRQYMLGAIAAATVALAVLLYPGLAAATPATAGSPMNGPSPASVLLAATPTPIPDWYPVPLDPAGAWVFALAVSPSFVNDHTIFATAHTSMAYYGVRKSTDGGASWTAMNDGISNLVAGRDLAISPVYADDQTIFLATYEGVYRSTNGGAHWVPLANGLPDPATNALAISPVFADDQTIFAATGSGVFKSTDGGETWTLASSGMVDRDGRLVAAWHLVISPDFVHDGTLFAGTPSYEVGGGLFKTTDGGGTWQEVNSGIPEYFGGITALRISPAYASDRTVFSGVWANRVYRSTNGGASWQSASEGIPQTSGPHLIVYALATSPDYGGDHTLFAGTLSGGVFRSRNGADSWTDLSNGLGSLNVVSLAFTPNAPYTLFAGTDNGLYRYSFPSTAPTRTPTPTWTPTVTPTPTATPTFFPTPEGGWPVQLRLPVILKP